MARRAGEVRRLAGGVAPPRRRADHRGHATPRVPDERLRAAFGRPLRRARRHRPGLPGGPRGLDCDRAGPVHHRGSARGDGPLPGPVRRDGRLRRGSKRRSDAPMSAQDQRRGMDPAAELDEASSDMGTMGSDPLDDNRQERSSMNEPLLSADDGEGFKDRWERIQVRFVDEPQAAVKEADALVQELMQRLADNFAKERGRLEGQWERGEEADTEDLRTALQQYRSFFRRLLAA